MEQDTKKNIEDIYELTSMQQGMLFHTLYTEGSDAYFEQFCYNLDGNLDEELFRKAWEEIVKRHGVLRTSFQWKGISKPVQIVSKNAELPWKNLDWSNLSKEQQENDFMNFIKQDRQTGFLMETAPLMRCTLIKLGDNSYQFVWSFHHIIMDGWSYPILQKEVFSFYEAFKKSEEVNLPKPLSYKQFILWLSKQDKAAAENFWRNELRGFESPTPMITNSKIGNEQQEGVNDIELKLSEELTTNLQLLAKQNQLTLNTIIQGVWGIILSVYRGENDVLFGGTVSGRTPTLKGIETMVGLFINTLPVRIKVDKDKDIISWLKDLQKNNIERNEFAHSSLVDIQEWSNIPRGMQLFENILVFENYPPDKTLEKGVAGIRVSNLRAFERTNFPLTILIAPGESLTIHAAYEISKFESSTIKQILSNFNILLEGIVKNPSGKISEFSLLTEEEENRILFEWNKTKHQYPAEKSIHQLFEEQAEKTPDEIAAELDGRKLTYRELNEKSNRLANYLINLGAGPEVKIGICIERSFEMLAGLLGILKTGAAYVPLDFSYPKERLSFMIEDADAPVLLTTQNLIDKLPETKATVVLADRDADKISKENKNNPGVKFSPSDLAYIIYTSGSTGKPKGVLMKHESLINLLYWQVEGQEFKKGYRVLQFTTLSFDVSFQEIFSTWYSGGTLVMLKEEDRQDLSKVLKIISDKKIQRIFLPFIALHQIAEVNAASKGKALALKEVITAGEQLQNTPAIINFFNGLTDFTFTNQYGPAEAHVVTSYKLSSDTKNWMKLPPIGKPIFNTQMYVLDSALEPVPVGVAGDLYIGGIGLVKGYHNREELTKEKFIDNPFYPNNKSLSEKLYRTGDIARYLPDGNIEYLGRTDNQVKMRGIRIELGEIETVLGEYPGIKNSAVVAKEFSTGDRRLIAYYVPVNQTALDSADIKKFLKVKLPEYMVPSDFVMLKEMPLTPTGKINHRALPAPESIRINESKDYAEPKETLELQLVKIWEKVLGVKPIGIKDNFFELGGHSLLALRVFGYVEKLTGRKLALSTLFNSPTIEQLAVILKDEGWTPPWKSLVAVKPGGSKLPFYCIPPASGTALHFQNFIKYLPDDQPFYVLESVGLDGKEKPHDSLEEMASHYIKEIQSLQPDGPYLLGGRCFGGRVAFEMAQQFSKLGKKVALLAIFDTWPPYTEPQQTSDPQEKDVNHFITRSMHHLKTGQFSKVVLRYLSIEIVKLKWKVWNKIEWLFSSKRKKLFKKIMLHHFKAQERYIAKKYPGKITLIECATYKDEFRQGWKNLAGGGFESYAVPDTNHKTIVKEPKLRFLAEKLNYVLEKTDTEVNSRNGVNGTAQLTQKENTLEKVNA
jgi:amino acid adenylation domain-containing protein